MRNYRSVFPELASENENANDTDDDSDDEDENSAENDIDLASVIIGAAIGFVAAGVMYVGPKVKSWVTDKAVPAIKQRFGRKSEEDVESSETEVVEAQIVENAKTMQIAYDRLRENITDEEAQREFIEMLHHLAVAAAKAKRLKDANIIDGEFIKEIVSPDHLELLADVMEKNPLLAQNNQRELAYIVNTMVECEVLKDD